ncbi:FAD synthetase, putative [Cordyceps militaris CM01]|uniref:FAD synthase n=2 Tax=Cordyceps militaris TaxID=73501 RepID=G3JIF4_CORMM|nr:FAD synthetase, putative [Cordyceps militaris CM01]ATY58661.1 phosphoadenosine phosphosulfate reductase [Cordyceps militaris]EGX91055.1 FAD synthetase, putative [Cordyceps militaris CM01]
MPSVQTNGAAHAARAINGGASTLPAVCAELRRQVLAFLDVPAPDETTKRTQEQIRISLQVVEEALKRYKFEELSLSYNGGKDCLCLLVLLLACLPTLPTASGGKTSTTDGNGDVPRIQAMYIAPPDPFPEMGEFVAQSTREYHLDLKQYTMAMRPALDAYLAETPAVRAIFMGTRRTDPYSEHLEHFSPTDAGWPQFMRINPMIDWHYVDIWIFLRRLEIPYCNLYNLGYTSLGGTSNTKPNPKLAVDTEGTTFRPAYDLTRDEDERLGRGR